MKKWFKRQRLILRCLWLRYKHKKELFELIFNENIPELGDILTDANGLQLMIVDKGHRDGNSWVSKAHVIYTPAPKIPPVSVPIYAIDAEFPLGYPVVMNGAMWSKQDNGEFLLQYQGEEFTA